MSEVLNDRVGDKIILMIKIMLELSDEEATAIDRNKDLMEEVGFDSLRAFSMVTAIHEMLEVDLPDEIDPSSVQTINEVSQYICNNYEESVINLMLEKSEDEIREVVDEEGAFDDL